MKGAIVHGVLLVAMLLLAYDTWTDEKKVEATTGTVVLWNEKASDLQAIVHETGDRTVRIEKKDGHWWGTDTRVTRKPKLTPEDAEPEPTTTVREFPVGDAAAPLVTAFPSMRAIRDLGQLTDDQKKEYELAESKKQLAVVFAGKTRTLVLGDRVLGGKDRYALDVDSGKGYVIAGSLVEPLEGGERTLVPKAVIPVGDEVGAITIAAGGKEKTVSRISVTDEAGKTVKTWGDAQTEKADQTTANFLTKIETSLKPTKYEPALDVASLQKLVTVTYRDPKGAPAGTLDLYKREVPPDPPKEGADPAAPPPAPTVEYFIVTDRTRVPAQVSKTSGDQVEQNIPTVFAE